MTEHSENVSVDMGLQYPYMPEWKRKYLASDISYAYTHYCDLVEDQHDMVEEQDDSSILESALPKLTALESIYVGREFHS